MPELYKIEQFQLTGEHSLLVTFDTGEKKDIDLSGILRGELYGPLADPIFFRKAYLDKEVHTIAWPNGADFNPETLYNWQLYKEDLQQMAKTWK